MAPTRARPPPLLARGPLPTPTLRVTLTPTRLHTPLPLHSSCPRPDPQKHRVSPEGSSLGPPLRSGQMCPRCFCVEGARCKQSPRPQPPSHRGWDTPRGQRSGRGGRRAVPPQLRVLPRPPSQCCCRRSPGTSQSARLLPELVGSLSLATKYITQNLLTQKFCIFNKFPGDSRAELRPRTTDVLAAN